jgi:hypothetical protein
MTTATPTSTTARSVTSECLTLLSQISLAEHRAGVYLQAWADVTPDADLRQAVAFVAGRETSHGVVFRQLIERLGANLEDRDDPKFAERLRIYGDPSVSDAEKIRFGRYGRDEGAIERFFASIDERIADETLDALTRDTLRWYVLEERDSGDLLRAAYARVEARGGAATQATTGSMTGPSADAQAIMACMTQGFASLTQSMKELAETLGRNDKRAR